ncbi:MAG TPA: hypothetical protein VEY87_09830 [Gaiellaceae bacterium]|nr:hypothetical protein [Gaiellaceae bacterium]
MLSTTGVLEPLVAATSDGPSAAAGPGTAGSTTPVGAAAGSRP